MALQVSGSFDYQSLDPAIVQDAMADAAAIRASSDRIKDSILDIGQRLARQRDALSGYFKQWVEAEFKFSRAHAYRFIAYYEAYKDKDLTGRNISTTALMQLAQSSVSEDTRDAILEQAQNKAVTVDDVKAALSQAGEKRQAQVIELLTTAPPVVSQIVGQYGVDSPGTIQALTRLAARGNGSSDTIREVLASGYIQPGDESEAVHITASSSDVERAIKSKANTHRQNAIDANTLAVVNLRGRVRVDGDGVFHVTPTENTAYPQDINGKRASITIRVYDE